MGLLNEKSCHVTEACGGHVTDLEWMRREQAWAYLRGWSLGTTAREGPSPGPVLVGLGSFWMHHVHLQELLGPKGLSDLPCPPPPPPHPSRGAGLLASVSLSRPLRVRATTPGCLSTWQDPVVLDRPVRKLL